MKRFLMVLLCGLWSFAGVNIANGEQSVINQITTGKTLVAELSGYYLSCNPASPVSSCMEGESEQTLFLYVEQVGFSPASSNWPQITVIGEAYDQSQKYQGQFYATITILSPNFLQLSVSLSNGDEGLVFTYRGNLYVIGTFLKGVFLSETQKLQVQSGPQQVGNLPITEIGSGRISLYIEY